jgi:hypothetical protein
MLTNVLVVVAKAEPRCSPRAAGVFPFRLAWQAVGVRSQAVQPHRDLDDILLAGWLASGVFPFTAVKPFAEFHSVVPIDVNHRVIRTDGVISVIPRKAAPIYHLVSTVLHELSELADRRRIHPQVECSRDPHTMLRLLV